MKGKAKVANTCVLGFAKTAILIYAMGNLFQEMKVKLKCAFIYCNVILPYYEPVRRGRCYRNM